MNKKTFSLKRVLSTLGIAKEVLNSVGEFAILYFSPKYLQCKAINFTDADDCYSAFQNICLDYCYQQKQDKSLFVGFPNEFSDGRNEDLGNSMIVVRDNQIEEVYELVNPEYYV